MDGSLFLRTARLLQHTGTREADYRSAISRAYYACFLTARKIAYAHCSSEACLKAHIKNERKIGHEKLQTYLKYSSIPAIRRLGEDLAGLSGNRGEADYNMSAVMSFEDASDAIEEADAFFEAISSSQDSEIGNAMERYIHSVSAQGS